MSHPTTDAALVTREPRDEARDEGHPCCPTSPEEPEIWPYVQRELLGRDVQDVEEIDSVRFGRYRDAERDSICLSLLSDEFYVSLLDPDAIESMVRRSSIDRSRRVLFHGRDGVVRDWAGDVLPPVSVLPRTG